MEVKKIYTNPIKVLDHGYIKITKNGIITDEDCPILGTGELEIINDAKVSFMQEADKVTKKEIRLLNYLISNAHTAPFRGSIIKMEVYAPLMIARQWWKYIVGSTHEEISIPQSPHTVWNESSRRYIKEKIVLHTPNSKEWRKKPINSKQGSGEAIHKKMGEDLSKLLTENYEQSVKLYEYFIEMGVAPEQARLALPAYSLYVRWRWTTSLQSLCHFLVQRLDDHAQWEIRQYAKAVYSLTSPIWQTAISKYIKNEGLRSSASIAAYEKYKVLK